MMMRMSFLFIIFDNQFCQVGQCPRPGSAREKKNMVGGLNLMGRRAIIADELFVFLEAPYLLKLGHEPCYMVLVQHEFACSSIFFMV